MAKPSKTQKQPSPINARPASAGNGSAGAEENRAESIRDRAHKIWESEGRPDNRRDEHWLQAEQELSQEGDNLEGQPNLDALREAAREHTDAFIVKSDLEDADQRESTPGVHEQP